MRKRYLDAHISRSTQLFPLFDGHHDGSEPEGFT